MYSITDLSRMFNIPSSTIRYYEKIGLLENVEQPNGYHRCFDESHVNRLTQIMFLKKALLPLSEMKTFFELDKDRAGNTQAILEMMRAQEENTRQAIRDLQDGLEHIQTKIHYFSKVEEAIHAGEPIPKWGEV